MPSSPVYGWLMLAALLGTLLYWVPRIRADSRLSIIYAGSIAGAFFGAKLVFLFSEGWLYWNDPNRWIILATGKSILGALLGGYLGVEIAKRLTHFNQPTGDLFALVVPLGILLGRIGCLANGCCLGRSMEPAWYTINDAHGVNRWPSVPVEILFNVAVWLVLLSLRRRPFFRFQLFHIYLIGYGLFRFVHESWRDTPRIVAALSGYQIAALVVAALGAIRFVQRRRAVPALV